MSQPLGTKITTVKELRNFITNLPDDLELQGFYDGAFGLGSVYLDIDRSDDGGDYLCVDVERD